MVTLKMNNFEDITDIEYERIIVRMKRIENIKKSEKQKYNENEAIKDNKKVHTEIWRE